MLSTLYNLYHRSAQQFPTKIALIFHHASPTERKEHSCSNVCTTLTYRQLQQQVSNIIQILQQFTRNLTTVHFIIIAINVYSV